MKTPSLPSLSLALFLILSCSSAASADGHDDFLECLSEKFRNYSSISNDIYTPANSSFASVLAFSIRNLRFATPSTPKPQVIITPEHESQIPPIVYCARENGLEIRTRSGGHDVEGLSWVSRAPFIVIDLIKLSEVTVDAVSKTAWIEAGATLGAVYYRVAEKSPVLGFPAGVCPTVGVGGHISGGGYGAMMRKFGLAADQVIDARIVDVKGRILDRKSMGEDLFWAIRGGGGAGFGIIVAWKVRLVEVPRTVTVFSVKKTMEQNLTQVLLRWQEVAPKLENDLFIGIIMNKVNTTIQANFWSLFFGGIDRLLPLIQTKFPELGLTRKDCREVSWIQAVLYFSEAPQIPPTQQPPMEFLLNRTQPFVGYSKIKSDYVQKPLPEVALQGIYRLLNEPNIQANILMNAYGGRMAEIAESATPFPHRAGNLFQLSVPVYWGQDTAQDLDRYISWSRRYYEFMAPYVSKSPRQAYLNYRDLDLGVNSPNGKTSYARASVYGRKYFKNNFDRLVRVKTVVDPTNFFKNEQSVPPLHSKWT